MSRRHVFVVCGLFAVVSVAIPAPVVAESVITSTRTTLRVRPGESARVVRRLTAGTRGEVLGRRGRWVKLKVRGRTGWVTRTTVQQAGSNARRTRATTRPRARSHTRTRTWKQDPKRRSRWMDKRAARKPGRVAAAQATPTPSPALAATDEDSDDESTAIPADKIGASSSATTLARNAPLASSAPRGLFAAGYVGGCSLAMDFTSNGQAGLGNYVIEAQAASAQVTVGVERSLGGVVRVAAEANYRFASSTPGIRYVSATGTVGDIAFSGHEVDVSIAGGVRVSPTLGGVAVLARGGYRYGVLLFDQVDNVGKLPSEDLAGATAGLELVVPRAADRLALRLRGDVLVAGERRQTAGLEDGATSTATAAWFAAHLSRAVSARMSLEGIYRYDRAHTSWTGPSPRQSDVMEAGRIDTGHTVVLGLAGQL